MTETRFNWKYFIGLQLLAFAVLIILKPWQPNGDRIIHWDVSIYYSYLPATFIYNDVGLEQDWPVDMVKYQLILSRPHGGKELLKMSMGMAYMYAPFFAIGHAVALLHPAIAANGFSLPYHLALAFAGVFWAVLGLYFLYLFLCRFVSQSVSVLSVAILFVGTNLLHYTFVEGAMSHASLFALLAVLLELGERYLENQSAKKAVLLGLLVGVIILIRPIMILPVLGLVIFYVIRLKGMIQWAHVPLILVAASVPWVPQMLYWQYITGSWLYYSYEGEGFFFTDPQIINGLFSWRKGWLVYTPIMSFSIVGFWQLYKRQRAWFCLIAPLFVGYIFVIFSWWCWWYGGSFSSRPMVEFYPFLALPLALFVQQIVQLRKVFQIVVFSVLLALASLNVFQMMQYQKSILHYDSMTGETYKAIFLKLYWPEGYSDTVRPPNYEAAKNGQRD